MLKRKFRKQENVNLYSGWQSSITSGEFGNPFNSITSQVMRQHDICTLILQCLVGCSCRKSPAKKAIQVTIYTQHHPEFQNPEEIFMSNWHQTAKTTAKGNLQRTAHSIIQKGASTQRHTRESKIRTKARKSTFFGVVRAF